MCSTRATKPLSAPAFNRSLPTRASRIRQERNIPFDRIVGRYFDALDAPLIVKSTQLGDAQVPKDPETGEPFPDYRLRMGAADRIVDLYGGKPRDVETPTDPPRGITIIVRREASGRAPVVVNPTGRTSIVPEGQTKHPTVPVRITRRGDA